MMESSEKSETGRDAAAFRSLWSAASVIGKETDPGTKNKAWDAVIADVAQANRLVAHAGEYGTTVADDPATLFRAARDRAQISANHARGDDAGPVVGSANEAVSAIVKPETSRDWSRVPTSVWEGRVRPLDNAIADVPALVGHLRITCASIDRASSLAEGLRTVKLEKCLDLTDLKTQQHLNISAKVLFSDDEMIWQIASEAYAEGFHGLIRLAANRKREKVIVAFGSL